MRKKNRIHSELMLRVDVGVAYTRSSLTNAAPHAPEYDLSEHFVVVWGKQSEWIVKLFYWSLIQNN